MTSSTTKKTSKDGVTSVVNKRGKHGPMATGSTLPGQPQEGQRGNVILEGYFWHEKRKFTLVIHRVFTSERLDIHLFF